MLRPQGLHVVTISARRLARGLIPREPGADERAYAESLFDLAAAKKPASAEALIRTFELAEQTGARTLTPA